MTITKTTDSHFSVIFQSPESTREGGGVLARFLETEGFLTEPLAITLEGPLGSGKTTFVKGFGEALGVNPEEIVSPTFSLANTHQGKIQFSHLDLFRLGESSNPNAEFLDSGLDEFLLGIALIEWPERLDEDFYPEMRLKIKIQTLDAASGKDMAKIPLENPLEGPSKAGSVNANDLGISSINPRLVSFDGPILRLKQAFRGFPLP